MSELEGLAIHLAKGADIKDVRGAVSRTADDVRDTATELALSTWTKYGRGMAGSAGRIEARMSTDRDLAEGYVIVRGVGGVMQERGTSHHPPQPVLQPAADLHLDTLADRLADVAISRLQ